MLLFGSITPAGGGGGGNFWQFSAIMNPLIDINQATGATGLSATTPSAEGAIINTDDFGSNLKVAGAIRGDGTNFNALVTANDTANGGDIFTALISNGANEESIIYMPVNKNGSINISSTKLSTGDLSKRSQDIAGITEEASDNNLNASQHNQNPNAQSFRFFNPTNGAAKATYQLDENESQIKDGAGVKTFSVLKNGEIQTNQAQPHNNTINTLTWDLPIYDTTGTLLGYIKVFT